ncbi:hypothetical protein GCM10022384_08920 [Streptomyces marokkonensis]|uniref:Uncharacterized protein n=1 Tax=Streptomyces marokkonensis TaxID=324855 RepID=A0ABP7P1M9_9ACTN
MPYGQPGRRCRRWSVPRGVRDEVVPRGGGEGELRTARLLRLEDWPISSRVTSTPPVRRRNRCSSRMKPNAVFGRAHSSQEVVDRVSYGVALPGKTIRAELDLPR